MDWGYNLTSFMNQHSCIDKEPVCMREQGLRTPVAHLPAFYDGNNIEEIHLGIIHSVVLLFPVYEFE